MNASSPATGFGPLDIGVIVYINTGHIGLEIREWNALIGIVTAIVGNILISFALNIQRYAHIRLNRDRSQKHRIWAAGKSRSNGTFDRGTEQERIATERAELNLNAPAVDEEDEEHQRRYHGGGEPMPSRKSVVSRSSSESTVKQEKKGEEPPQSTTYLKSPYWWAGILLMTTGEAGNFLAYGFAPASIVSPLGVVALVSNCIIAPWLLKERFRQRDFWGVVVAVAGAVTVVLSAKNVETKMGPKDVWTAITRWEFEVYLGITGALIVVLMWASGKYGEKSVLIDLGLVGLFGMLKGTYTLECLLILSSGGYTVLSTKGVASLLSDTLWRTLTFPITYLLLFILIGTAIFQIRYVNRALQRFDSTQVIPTQFVLFTISVIIGSAILYRDFEAATVERVAKFAGGCLLTFLGVYLITSGRSSEESSEDEDIGDEEEAIRLIDDEAPYNDSREVDDWDAINKRKSLANITPYDGVLRNGSKRASRQQSSGQLTVSHTPRRFNSSSSSNLFHPPHTPDATPESPLLSRTWASSQEHLSTRRSLKSTASSPVLPSESQRNRPATDRVASQQNLLPPRAERPLALTRNSIVHLLPGPLVSPLSSSLSAVVADNLRRGVNSPIRPRRRRGLSGLHERQTVGTDGPESPLLRYSHDVSHDQSEESPVNTSWGKGRSRSMNLSLGSLFTFRRGNSKSEDDGSEVADRSEPSR